VYQSADQVEIAVINLESVAWMGVYRYKTFEPLGWMRPSVSDGNLLMLYCFNYPKILPFGANFQNNVVFPIG
jgi:hypothetical protein